MSHHTACQTISPTTRLAGRWHGRLDAHAVGQTACLWPQREHLLQRLLAAGAVLQGGRQRRGLTVGSPGAAGAGGCGCASGRKSSWAMYGARFAGRAWAASTTSGSSQPLQAAPSPCPNALPHPKLIIRSAFHFHSQREVQRSQQSPIQISIFCWRTTEPLSCVLSPTVFPAVSKQACLPRQHMHSAVIAEAWSSAVCGTSDSRSTGPNGASSGIARRLPVARGAEAAWRPGILPTSQRAGGSPARRPPGPPLRSEGFCLSGSPQVNTQPCHLPAPVSLAAVPSRAAHPSCSRPQGPVPGS